jgi:hypothetical protein
MSKAKRNNGLIEAVKDRRWIDFFYLEDDIEALMRRLHDLRFRLVGESRNVPFNAQVRGYQGALDDSGALWIVKEVEEGEEFFYSLCELAYYLDFMLQTLSAPTLLVNQEGVYYRATKVIVEATQISGYNYLEEPYLTILANDLINRWLMFDEDRNPNNYMVIHNSAREPLVVAIDFNHADLEAAGMKITGNEKQFGWHRTEKTRFLTLLKPENFERFGIADFEERLGLLMAVPEERLKKICGKLFLGVSMDPKQKAQQITDNLVARRGYIDAYFRKSFAGRAGTQAAKTRKTGYEGLGAQFVEIFKKRV